MDDVLIDGGRRVRMLRKKLRQTSMLEDALAHGVDLNPDQMEKLGRRGQLTEELLLAESALLSMQVHHSSYWAGCSARLRCRTLRSRHYEPSC